MKYKMRFFWLLLIILSSYLNAQSILVLHSYEEYLKWTDTQNEEIKNKLKRYKSSNLEKYVEFMDTKILRLNKQREDNLLNYYKKKYKNINFDIIITTDDNALNFVRKYKNNKIFKNAKVFFCGVNNLSLKNTLDKNIYAGVFEVKNPIGNLKLAKKINQHLRTIYLFADNTPSGNKIIKLYKNKLKAHKEIKYIYLNNKDINKILTSLKDYDKNSLMILLTFNSFYQNGKHIDSNKVIQLLSNRYKNPMLINSNIYISIPNSNIVGGDCTDAKTQGDIASNKAIEYLNGKQMKNISFQIKNTNKIYLNEKNLEKFGIKISDFDIKNSIVTNKKQSFYTKYYLWINILLLFMVSIIFITIIFIILLKIKVNKQLNYIRKKDKQMLQQSRLAQMGEMISMIAHQWRQPLAAISSTTNAINLKAQLNKLDKDIAIELSTKIDEYSQHLSSTINDFREFFKPNKEKKETTYDEVIKSVLNIVETSIVNKNIKLIKNLNSKTVFNTYPNELKQVVLNLIKNAEDALQEVALGNVLLDNKIENPTITITTKDNILTVSDNAGGVPEEIIDKIFDPYFSTKTKKDGTGVGLYMSKTIIEEHCGGELSVSNSEAGAAFKIELNGEHK